MNGNFINYKTRYQFLTHLWNDKNVRDLTELVKRVKNAEINKILVVKREKNKTDESYRKNISWYLGQLERGNKIKGFLSSVGRPKKIISKKKSVQRKT